MGSLKVTLCAGVAAVAATLTPTAYGYAAEPAGGVSVTPSAPAPGDEVTLKVPGCAGKKATAASKAFVHSLSEALQHELGGVRSAALGTAALDVLAGAAQSTLGHRARHGVARAGARLEHQRHGLFHAAQGLDPPLLEGAGTELCTHCGFRKAKAPAQWRRGFACRAV